MEAFDHITDVVVVGCGAGGMVSAWASARLGLETLIVEKATVFGGNSALSGGGAWLPNAPYFQRIGESDDPEAVYQYLRTIAPEVKPERQRRYLEAVPELAAAFESTPYYAGGKGFDWLRGYSDYFPDKGGNPKGRGLWPTPLDERVLGEDMTLRRGHGRKGRLAGTPPGMWMTSGDLHQLLSLRWGTIRGPAMLMRLAWRSLVANLLGWKMITAGAALVTRLRLMLRDAGVPVWLNTRMTSFITNATGDVIGIEVLRDGKPFRIAARHGVVMASGGFEGSKERRAEFQPDAIHAGSQGSPDNTGDWIDPAKRIGAALSLMDDAWWMPALQYTPGTALGMVPERQYPHQFIVNAAGKRYVNESCPYTEFGHKMIEGHRTGVGHFPSFMILDQFAWKHYFFRGLPGRRMPKEWLSSGMVQKANSIEELAGKIGVPPAALRETTDRFNAFARRGVDEDFHRGENAYNNYYGNPKYKNPNLGEVKKGPFYAFRVVLSDLGTKGGMLTDEDGRVLREDGSAIGGLYAVGNNSAAVMGHSYAGPGATLGPAMTFGWVAAHHIREKSRLNRPDASLTQADAA
jgi:succinate dehydrogenase/fumarate reductase flavoprotein subunit